MITGRYGMEAVSGPVGVVSAIDNTVKQEKGYSYLPTLFVLISINLGVVNLLPLPALDGGRIVFVLVEAVRRKRISAEKEGLVHLVGLAVLVALIVFISIFDIIDLFS
jgi:regulator of sigma E protease